MNELTTQEMEQTSGGFLPLVGVALAVASKVTATGPAGWAISSAGLVLASYQAMETYAPNPFGQTGTGGFCPAP